jgi:predicted RNA-binding protein with PUA-like domain
MKKGLMKYWLFKSEPGSFSIDDLAASKNKTTHWEGVRNFQARNFLRDDVARGDLVFFYHSIAKPSGIAGICEVTRAGYPDHTALDPESKYFDPRASKDNPIWYMVDVKLRQKFGDIIPLRSLKETPGLEGMMVCQKGSRLSIQPVTAAEWKIILGIAARL